MKVPNETYPEGAVWVWDVLSGWQKWHGMLCPGWQKQHGMLCPGRQKLHGMFCPGWQIFVGCFVRGVKKWHGMFCPGMFCPASLILCLAHFHDLNTRSLEANIPIAIYGDLGVLLQNVASHLGSHCLTTYTFTKLNGVLAYTMCKCTTDRPVGNLLVPGWCIAKCGVSPGPALFAKL